VLTENDETVNNADAVNRYDALIKGGAQGEYHLIEEHPLPPERFERIEYFDAETSEAIFDAAVQIQLVDDEGVRTVDIGDVDDQLTFFSDEYVDVLIYPSLVRAQLRATWCMHRLNAALKIRQRDFFLSHL